MTPAAPRGPHQSIFAVPDTSDVGARSLGDLHGEVGAHPTGRTDDENPLTRFHRRHAVVTAWSAVPPEIGVTAACSNVALAGLRASCLSGAVAYSAKEPLSLVPYTSSPGRSGSPASPPGDHTGDIASPNRDLGLVTPNPMAWIM